MGALRISIHEVETENGAFLCMSAGEFTGVFAPMPVSDADQATMKQQVLDRADYYLGLPDDAELPEDHDITLAEIKESIWTNMVKDEPEGVEA